MWTLFSIDFVLGGGEAHTVAVGHGSTREEAIDLFLWNNRCYIFHRDHPKKTLA